MSLFFSFFGLHSFCLISNLLLCFMAYNIQQASYQLSCMDRRRNWDNVLCFQTGKDGRICTLVSVENKRIQFTYMAMSEAPSLLIWSRLLINHVQSLLAAPLFMITVGGGPLDRWGGRTGTKCSPMHQQAGVNIFLPWMTERHWFRF